MFGPMRPEPAGSSGDAEAVRLAKALDWCMVGGNSLASALIGALGGDMPSQFENSDQALEALWGKRADTDDMLYEAWTCWKVMMEARAMVGGPDWFDQYREAVGRGEGEA